MSEREEDGDGFGEEEGGEAGRVDEGQGEDEDLHLDVEVPRVREAPVLAPRRRQVVDV